MRRTLAPTLLACVLACALALTGCGQRGPAPASPSPPSLASFIAHVDRSGPARSWDGTVQAVQQADVAAQTSGRVLAVDVDVGSRVAAGQVLVRLTAVEQQSGQNVARAQLQAAQAAAAEAEASYARYQALAQRQLISRLQMDQIRARRDAAVAARNAAQAQLASAGEQAGYTLVRAPFAGIVQARSVDAGEAVAPGRVLVSLYAPGALRVQAQVPESDAAALRQLDTVSVRLADGRSVDARSLTVFPAADPDTHSVGVRAELPALTPAPAPGTSARLQAGAGTGAAALWLPRQAIVQRGEVSAVYVLADGWPQLRQIRTGDGDGARVQVLAGLREGERVASDPSAALQVLVQRRQRAGGDHD